MKTAALLAGLIIGLACAPAQGADEGKGWKVLWYPWEEMHSSWDWRFDGDAITTQWLNNEPFPVSVQNWQLAICSTTDPDKRRLIPLPSPMDITPDGQRYWHLERWTPGNFPLAKFDTLDSLGEGTFLCAIIGDGHRYSN